ncbi:MULTISPECIES: diaminopimelate decarboxylase [unclassified Dehalobacter]|uniref:diaminopimelate decarboxylase n=1 Tax=unclassified Dehalobacter TaxID=2635733 RepID=UPI000E6C19B1|nr:MULTISPECIES: diaminopimelate decarboxylase [unclassified Dehalobacter]RJE48430.1 diaminopimelate decarboxylase [Dehalobacter sp. MCB1]TCX50498.1 diaminopimelate decarboxylase [Dehalobacter sp. 14DCB1]TCX52262.1 diaminopimelate decarboxylase [Dehalobacter sp. 12DCB1]
MSNKSLPFSSQEIERIAQEYGTPFHIYDEKAIRKNVRRLQAAFAWNPGFKEYFAVKATPNPYILKILAEEGTGADCSSLPELILAEKAGLKGENIVFSSNDTPAAEFRKAKDLGAIINLDDITHIDFLSREAGIPEMISFRYNPGPLREGNTIIGKPEDAKYGLTREQLFEAYAKARVLGAERFGIHTMVISNELDPEFFVETARMMFELAVELKEKLGVRIEIINLGGGIGIPYRLGQDPVDLEYVGKRIKQVYEQMIVPAGLDPLKVAMECGRMITGPYGYLVARVLHKKEIYKNYIGLDASMSDLMRPGIYGAYHHITVVGKEQMVPDHQYDVTGGLCENNDKFAIDRILPKMNIGDLVVIHDTGAHGHAMGFNYNGKLRSKELLLKPDGQVEMIRRAETIEDYFATLDFSGLN